MGIIGRHIGSAVIRGDAMSSKTPLFSKNISTSIYLRVHTHLLSSIFATIDNLTIDNLTRNACNHIGWFNLSGRDNYHIHHGQRTAHVVDEMTSPEK